MATGRNKDDAAGVRASKAIDKKLDLLNSKMDSLYKDIYTTRPDNRFNLDNIINSLDDTIDRLQGSDGSVSGMTELLRRVEKDSTSNTAKMMNSVKSLFEDETLMGSLLINQDMHNYIAGQNYNYDLICKYLPKLQDALEIKRDNVLCSDNLNKNFLNPRSYRSSKEELEKFNVNIKRIEEEYDISEFLDKTYMNTSKYGEDFIYVVPYTEAFKRLIRKHNMLMNSSRVGTVTLFENYTESVCLKKGFQESKDFANYLTIATPTIIDEDANVEKAFPELGEVKLHFNNSGMVNSIVQEYCILTEKNSKYVQESLSHMFESASVNEAKSEKLDSMFDNVTKQNRYLMKGYSSDGLVLNKDLINNNDPDKIDDNILGAVLERLPRENILPVWIGKKCLGYYYFEFAEDPNRCGFCGGHHSTPIVGNASRLSYNMNEYQHELAVRYIASKISSAIDTKFINANKDLKEEIYQILNYNIKFDVSRSNDIGITFIPADDIVHCYFEIDEHSHRGISDLHRALMPAMLYILLYLTDIIGKITRSTDKRVYYVKQNVETNIARTMMNVVQQIKKGNMGIRQIESMNNILNIVGKYNDVIIPVGPSGDYPVQMEILNGQDIQTPTDIMEKMEEAAVNTIMPIEFVNSTMQQDFATRFSASNSRFLKTIYTRQRKTERFFSKIYTKVYNYEFGDTYKIIEIMLPPPTFLTMNNNSQLIDNITQSADKIIDVIMPNEEDDIKAEWKRLYVVDALASYINFEQVERNKEIARINVEANKVPSAEDGDNSVNSIDDDDGF